MFDSPAYDFERYQPNPIGPEAERFTFNGTTQEGIEKALDVWRKFNDTFLDVALYGVSVAEDKYEPIFTMRASILLMREDDHPALLSIVDTHSA